MNRRNLILGMVLGAAGLTTFAPAAHADFLRYRSYTYFRGRDSWEVRRREALRARLFDLASRVEAAERNRAISRRDAAEIFEDLDDVSDFLRHERYLTDSEYARRLDDLRDAERDLRDALRDHRGRYYDRDRYYDRYR
jgi:hypothetical protein